MNARRTTRARNAAVMVASVVSAAAGMAHADEITMHLGGTGAGQNVRVVYGGYTVDIFAGQLQYTVSGASTGREWMMGTRIGYGADVQYYATSPTMFTVTSAAAVPSSQNLAMGSAKEQALRDVIASVGGVAFGPNASNDQAAAFQIFLWELIGDYSPSTGASSIDVTSGNVRFAETSGAALSSGVMSALSTYVAAIGASATSINEPIGLVNASAMDTVMMVPTAGSGALMAAAGGMVVGRRRRVLR